MCHSCIEAENVLIYQVKRSKGPFVGVTVVRVRVLVVEDERRMADMLRRGLTEDGYSVDVTRDGIDAVWMASEVGYDAVLLDVNLPGISGVEVCRRLRAKGVWVPVLMVTSRTAIDDRVVGLDVGADDYLAKPFSFVELHARIRALIRRGSPPRPTVLAAGGLYLDPAARSVRRDAVQLCLSAKEFELLKLFLQHVDEVLSRDFIVEHAWDFAFQLGSNIVDQHVASIRRKIDRPFHLDQLETVRGAGYRLRSEPIPLAGAVRP